MFARDGVYARNSRRTVGFICLSLPAAATAGAAFSLNEGWDDRAMAVLRRNCDTSGTEEPWPQARNRNRPVRQIRHSELT
jgi:hypothetical protein